MMSRVRAHHVSLCVLRVSTGVLDLPEVMIADSNAASKYVRFAASPSGLALIDRDLVFAESWMHPGDQIREWQHKAIKCAEVLVPDRVDPGFVSGAYVSCEQSGAQLAGAAPTLHSTVDADLFFQVRR